MGSGGAAKLLESQKQLSSTASAPSIQPSSSGLGPQPVAPIAGAIKQPPMAGKYQPPPHQTAVQTPPPPPTVAVPAKVHTSVATAPKSMNEDEPQIVSTQPPVAASSKFAALGGVKGAAVTPDAPAPKSKEKKVTKEKESKKRSKKEEEGSDDDDEGGDDDSSDGGSSSDGSGSESEGDDEGSSSGEEDDSSSEESEGEDGKKKKKKKAKATNKDKAKKGKDDKKPKATIEKAKKTKPLKPTHEEKPAKKSKKSEAPVAAAEVATVHYPYTPERTPPVSKVVAESILSARKPFTKEQEEEIEKFENSNHTHCADLVAKGFRLIHSASYDINNVSFRKETAEKAENEEKRKKNNGSSEDGVPPSDKGRNQAAITYYVKTLAENPWDHFDVWWSDEKQRAYMACTFRVEEFLAQNPALDGPEAYARVRCVLGRVHARLARSITQRSARSPGTKRVYYTNTVFNEKSFGAGKDLGATPENPKWVPEPLWTSEQVKTEVKAAEAEATKRELRKQEEELAEAHEADKKKEKAKEEEKAASKKRAKEEKKAKTPKKARAEPEPAVATPMVGVVVGGNNNTAEQNSLIIQNQRLETTIAQLTLALDSAKAAYAASCASVSQLRHGKPST